MFKALINPRHFYKKVRWILVKYFLSVSGRLFFYTVIPSCLITAVLCALYSTYLLEYHHAIFMQKGQVDYYKIQSSLQYGIYTKNHGVIHSALQRLNRRELKKLTIVDNHGRLLYSSVPCGHLGNFQAPVHMAPQISFFTRYAQFIMPLEMNTLPDFVDLDDFVSKDNQENIGWVVFEYNLNEFWYDHRNILSLAMMFLIQSILLCYLISRHVDNKVTQPMIELLRGLRSLEFNGFRLDLKRTSFGEMSRLQRSAAKMADSLQIAHKGLQSKIDSATLSLRSSMEKIEEQKQQLEIAHKKSEETSESKSQFLAHMSHEYKTPLNSVIGFVDLMLQERLTPVHRNYCETIKNSAKHLLSMIDDILDFNLIEAGRLAIREKKINLRDCIEDVINSLNPLAKEKKIALNYIYYQDVPEFVVSDRYRLHQILINLISNAIKFTDKGYILVRVALDETVSPIEKNKESIQITVQDTGCGIPKDIQKNLFKPFCHTQKQYAPGRSGSGLGLVITKKIVGLLSGDISYETVCNHGTKFSIRLPFIVVESGKDPIKFIQNKNTTIALIDKGRISPAIHHQIAYLNFKVDHYSTLESLEKKQRHYQIYLFALHTSCDINRVIHYYKSHKISVDKVYLYSFDESLVKFALNKISDLYHTFTLPIKTFDLNKVLSDREPHSGKVSFEADNVFKTVLIVDDNPINTKLLSSYLKKYSLSVSILHDSKDFIKTVSSQSFDMIFLDIFMPNLDGIDCIRALRASDRGYYRQVPVIAVTANSLANNDDKLSKEGFCEVLYKPLCPRFINSVLKKYLLVDIPLTQRQLDFSSAEHNIVLEQCRDEVKVCLDYYYQSKFQDLADKVHMLLGIVGYSDGLEEIYQLLSQLDQLLRSDTINKKKVLRCLKRLSVMVVKTDISHHQQEALY